MAPPVVAPVVTVVASALPAVPVRFPMQALAMRSPASTWKAAVLEVNASCLPPVASVCTEATMPGVLERGGRLRARRCRALWMALLMAVTSELDVGDARQVHGDLHLAVVGEARAGEVEVREAAGGGGVGGVGL